VGVFGGHTRAVLRKFLKVVGRKREALQTFQKKREDIPSIGSRGRRKKNKKAEREGKGERRPCDSAGGEGDLDDGVSAIIPFRSQKEARHRLFNSNWVLSLGDSLKKTGE